MKNKIMTPDEAVSQIKDGSTVMIGGFLCCGAPEILIDALVKKASKNLTIISNDAGVPPFGVSKLIANNQVKTIITSHVGLNPEVSKRMNSANESEKIECILVPQGTLAEKIRAGGFGLGGILTPTGIGTLVAQGKQIINVKGKDYLLELGLKADFALIYASKIDKDGNIFYTGTTRNFNPLMATAADFVIASACEIVETGSIDPDIVMTPGIFIDAIVEGEK